MLVGHHELPLESEGQADRVTGYLGGAISGLVDDRNPKRRRALEVDRVQSNAGTGYHFYPLAQGIDPGPVKDLAGDDHGVSVGCGLTDQFWRVAILETDEGFRLEMGLHGLGVMERTGPHDHYGCDLRHLALPPRGLPSCLCPVIVNN